METIKVSLAGDLLGDDDATGAESTSTSRSRPSTASGAYYGRTPGRPRRQSRPQDAPAARVNVADLLAPDPDPPAPRTKKPVPTNGHDIAGYADSDAQTLRMWCAHWRDMAENLRGEVDRLRSELEASRSARAAALSMASALRQEAASLRTELTRAEREVERAGFLRALAVAQPGAAPPARTTAPPVDDPVDQLAGYIDEDSAQQPPTTDGDVAAGTADSAGRQGTLPADGDGLPRGSEAGEAPTEQNAALLADTRVKDLEGDVASLRTQLVRANARSQALAEALTTLVSQQSLPLRQQLLEELTQGTGGDLASSTGGAALLRQLAAGSAASPSHSRASPRASLAPASSLRQPTQLTPRTDGEDGWETPPSQSPRSRPPPASRADVAAREASTPLPYTAASPATQPPDSVVVLATRVAELELRAQRAETSCSELRRALATARAAAAGTADDASVTSASSSGTAPLRGEPTTSLPAAVPADADRPAAKLLAGAGGAVETTPAAITGTESALAELPRAELAAAITRLRQRLHTVMSQRFNGVMHANAVMTSIAGAVCLKFRGHGSHRADRRWLSIALDKGLLGWSKRLQSGSSYSTSVPLATITRVFYGQRTPAVLLGPGADVLPGRCFSVCTAKRTYDFAAGTSADAARWVHAIQFLSRSARNDPSPTDTASRLLWQRVRLRIEHFAQQQRVSRVEAFVEKVREAAGPGAEGVSETGESGGEEERGGGFSDVGGGAEQEEAAEEQVCRPSSTRWLAHQDEDDEDTMHDLEEQ